MSDRREGEVQGSGDAGPRVIPVSPAVERVRAEAAHALGASPRRLPSRFFYDEAGARLFDEITRLDEYYLTDAEMEILRERAAQVAAELGPGVRMVEYGSGSGEKTWILLDALERPSAYVPVDVSRQQLEALARQVKSRFPRLEVLPVAADYTDLQELPWPTAQAGETLAFFPGSTVGNLEPEDAVGFLSTVGSQTGQGAYLLIGVDLVKDREVLTRAYNDARGVTARFNKNILLHLNRLLGANFDPEGFRHRAVWNAEASRMEMHLVSTRDQEVSLGGGDSPRLTLAPGEPIVTEHSYKYELPTFREMVHRAGYAEVEIWTDARNWFSVQLLRFQGRSSDGDCGSSDDA